MILTLETVKSYLQVTHSAQDELLQILIASAQDFVSSYTGIHFHSGDGMVTELLDGGGENLWPRCLPLKEIISVTDLDAGSTPLEEQLRFTQTRIMRETNGVAWGSGAGRYEVKYLAGYTAEDCPAGVKHLLLDLVYRHYCLRGDKAADADGITWHSLALSGGMLNRLREHSLRIRSIA